MAELQDEIVLDAPRRFLIRQGPVPEPGPGEALIRVRHIGICGTDIHAFHGRQPFFEYPRILGHELGGEVLACDGGSAKVGDLVAVEPYLNDPTTPASRRGRTNCCESLQVLGVHCDGGMRPVIRVPAGKLHPSTTLATDALALVEMLCIGAHAVARAQIEAHDHVAVLGAGPIGMSVLQFLTDRVERVTIVDLAADRLDFCRDAFGVERRIRLQPGQTDLAAELRNAGEGELPNVILDATGNAQSMAGAFELCAHGGTLVFVGLFQGDVRFDDPNFHRRELTLKASRNATAEDFQRVMRGLETGEVSTDTWITHRLELRDIPEQLPEVMAQPALRKAVVEVA